MIIPESVVKRRKEICKALAEKIKEKKITQAQLAEKTGMKQESISRMFNGEWSPRLDFLLAVADAAEIPVPFF